MYSTCLFCARPLGRNEALEHFPIGRRLAYDPAKGRLWVVCGRCERWNLSPLETRWEAIEEAERAYRGAVLRVSSDNIGLAQLPEGLELVRVGSPPRVELVAWRYGDQFGRRRRRRAALFVIGAGVAVGQLVTPWLGATLAGGFGVLSIGQAALGGFRDWTDTRRPRLSVRDESDNVLLLTYQNARCAALVPIRHNNDWRLTLPFRQLRGANGLRDVRGPAVLSGEPALRALATMLPYLNRAGGSTRRVREATDVLEASGNVGQLLRVASVNTEAKKTHVKIKDGESNVGALPARIRLALEMALHEDDERRAMEGELHLLAQRWRDAEEIAAIADALTIPSGVDDQVAALRARRDE